MKPAIRILPIPSDSVYRADSSCAFCAANRLCLSGGLERDSRHSLERLIVRRRIERDHQLFRLGDPFRNLYTVRFGHFKSIAIRPCGESQIVGLHMSGDVMGSEAIGAAHHHSTAVALEDSEVCVIPFAGLEQIFVESPHLLHQFHRILGRELARQQERILLLGGARGEQRLAAFLLDLSWRYAARGYSGARYRLRMSREEIGLYLGLTIESVSRMLSRFRRNGWIDLNRRDLEIRDRTSLEALAAGPARSPLMAMDKMAPFAGVLPEIRPAFLA